ncbi:hypothetical protein [Bradyrhizobium lablabi]|uniref:hypothetical protein n=1 Tax=Bradyrhizobium lablabi TaxID=722472 RepID=UPI001BA90A41|nr:hypothetical protein [Bradyrhizobium lablabi]MBR0695228.1 hypothetical protein [Bradyrhizobium lablabi]
MTNAERHSSFAYLLFFALLLACGLYVAFIAGPALRASAQDRFHLAITEEDRDFCEKFGMRAGTSEFLACTNELAVIRQKQVDRDRATEIGLL